MSTRTIREYRKTHWTVEDEVELHALLYKRERCGYPTGRPIRRVDRQAKVSRLLRVLVAAAQKMDAREELVALCRRRGIKPPAHVVRNSTTQARIISQAARDLGDVLRRPVVERKVKVA